MSTVFNLTGSLLSVENTPRRARPNSLAKHQRLLKMCVLATLIHLIALIQWTFSSSTSLPWLSQRQAIEASIAPEEPKEAKNIASQHSLDPTKQEYPSALPFKPKTLHLSLKRAVVLNSPKHITRRTISAGAHQQRDAAYLSRWQHYVERFGNLHYPKIASDYQLKGDLRLLVAIDQLGKVETVEIRQSSGDPRLDEAAIALVHQAAPFEPLPEEIARDTHVLEIIRTWQFRGQFASS